MKNLIYLYILLICVSCSKPTQFKECKLIVSSKTDTAIEYPLAITKLAGGYSSHDGIWCADGKIPKVIGHRTIELSNSKWSWYINTDIKTGIILENLSNLKERFVLDTNLDNLHPCNYIASSNNEIKSNLQDGTSFTVKLKCSIK